MQTRRVVASISGCASYDIRIGAGVIERLGRDLKGYSSLANITQAVIITDANVGPLYAQCVADALRSSYFTTHILTIPAGEDAKSIEVVMELWQALSQLGCGRPTVIVSLGGGAVSDVAGFIAATYMRGISVVHVPTSLLAMIDACVGGKTAINLPKGKNLVGAFKQPAYVCTDLEMLRSLPDEEWTSGLGELAKMAIIDSDDFFFWLMDHAHELAQGPKAVNDNYDTVAEAVSRALVAKMHFVSDDEYDTAGERAILNYGHTLGHALEQQSGFSLKHGYAVAEGMRFAARLAVARRGMSLALVEAQDELLDALGIPQMGDVPQTEELIACMHLDKKAASGMIRFVLPRDIGDCSVIGIDDRMLSQHLEAWAAQKNSQKSSCSQPADIQEK